MKNCFKLLRPINLAFLFVIQLLVYCCVVQPILQIHGFESTGIDINFVLLTLSCVLIAAGGYVLNDYFDLKIDTINRPDRQIVGNMVSKRAAMRIYQILTGLGLVAGIVLAVLLRSFTLGFVFVVVVGLLWFYSASYKRQFLLGNIIVSLVASLSIFMVAIMEIAALTKTYNQFIFMTQIPRFIYIWVGGFAVFAFILTLIREIIKDAEDMEGDSEMECHTMPIVCGIPKTKIVLYALISITIISLLIVNQHISLAGTLTFRYTLFGVIVPLLALSALIFVAKTPKDFHQASTLAKIIMLLGTLYSLIFYFLLAKQFNIPIFGVFMVN